MSTHEAYIQLLLIVLPVVLLCLIDGFDLTRRRPGR
jgi:hypothetical protein